MENLNNNHAVIIGVGADLPVTVDDAKILHEILTDAEICKFDEKNVALLTEQAADRASVLAALDALAARALGDTTAIVYFSGHGLDSKGRLKSAYYLLPHGYNTADLPNTAISVDEFADKLKAITATRLLVLLDCCHAQGVGLIKSPTRTVVPSPMPEAVQKQLTQGSGRAVIASCKRGEVSFTGKPYSLFTRALVEALYGANAGENETSGVVKVLDIAMYTRGRVERLSRQRQHPEADVKQADNFAVAYYAGGKQAKPKSLGEIPLPPIDEDMVERENAASAGQRDQLAHNVSLNNSGINVQGSTVNGDIIQANDSKGFNNRPTGPVNQNFGTVHTGGGAYIGGTVTVNGDFVGRDMTKTTHNGASVAEFVSLIEKMKTQVAALPLGADEKAEAQQTLDKAKQEAGKDKPNTNLLKSRLETVKGLIEGVVGVGTAAATLLPMLEKGLAWVGQLWR